MYYGGFTYTEAYNLPLAFRRWFVERIIKEINGKDPNNPPPNRAVHTNDAQTRELQGMSRNQTPSRLRRFT